MPESAIHIQRNPSQRGIVYNSSKEEIYSYLRLKLEERAAVNPEQDAKIRKMLENNYGMSYLDALDLEKIFEINADEADIVLRMLPNHNAIDTIVKRQDIATLYKTLLPEVLRKATINPSCRFNGNISLNHKKREKAGTKKTINLTPQKSKKSAEYGQLDHSALALYLKEIRKPEYNPLSREEEYRLAREIKAGSKEALEKLTKASLRYVVSVAKQYQNRGLPLLILIAEGNIGVIRAAETYDDERGTKFISYAKKPIQHAIMLALKEQTRIVRLPENRFGTNSKINREIKSLQNRLGFKINPYDYIEEIVEETGVTKERIKDTLRALQPNVSFDKHLRDNEPDTLYDFFIDDSQVSPEEETFKQILDEEIREIVNTLTPREAEIIKLHSGINPEGPLNLEEIGVKIGLTRERVRQIKERAMNTLRIRAKKKGLEEKLKNYH